MRKYLLIVVALIACFVIFHLSYVPPVSNIQLADPFGDELAEFGNKLQKKLEKGETRISLSDLLPPHEDNLFVCFHSPKSEQDWWLSFPSTLNTDNFLGNVSMANDSKTGLPFILAQGRRYIVQLPDNAKKRIYCVGEANGSLRIHETNDPQTAEILISADETGYPPVRKP